MSWALLQAPPGVHSKYMGFGLDLAGLGSLPYYDRDDLEKDISDKNKSSGLGGLSYEFYKTVWNFIRMICLKFHSANSNNNNNNYNSVESNNRWGYK